MKFHEKIQNLRKEKGLSQEELAEMMQVSRQSVSKWESAQAYPETDKLIVLSEIFGVTIDSLLKDTETEADNQNTISSPYWVSRGNVYEYKSERTFNGLPLIHIHIGLGARKAKGVIAIGNVATGLISIGLVSAGFLSLGLLSAGILSFGLLTIGLLLAIGTVSIGTLSIGAIAIGLVTIGALSFGVYSLGALSVASRVAVGDSAYAPIAVGRKVKGVFEFIDTSTARDFSSVSGQEVKQVILEQYPDTWDWVVELMTWVLGR